MVERLRQKAEKSEAGFTLIELLVVIVILGILAAVVVFAVGGIGDKGQTSACKIDERTLRTAEEAYSGQPGPGGGDGLYTAQDDASVKPPVNNRLVTGGFLSDVPQYHNVTSTNGGKDFQINPVGKCVGVA